MDNLVSVIMPCYNAELYLDMSIGSVFEQDYSALELIVVNDGSTDRSEEKILSWQKKFAERGFSLIYLYQENQGPGAATNLGLKYVSGKYLTLLDADDRFLPNSIMYRAEYLDKNMDCAGVRSNGWRVKGSSRVAFITEEKEKKISDLFTALSLGRTNNWAGTYMVRTDILFDVYPDRNILPSRLGQNFQILLPVAYNRKFGFVDVCLMEYHIYDDSHSHTSDALRQYTLAEENASGWREIYLQILDMLVKNPDEHLRYERMYNSVYFRRGMNLALTHKKTDKAREYYRQLKATQLAGWEDHVTYLSATNRFFAFIYRIARNLKKCAYRFRK